MRKKIPGLLLSITGFPVFGFANTVTLRNNAEINCVVSYQDGTFTFVARYATGSKTFKFDRAEVRTIEINQRDFNPGEPPKDISIFDQRSADTRNASQDVSLRPPTPNKPKGSSPKHSVLDSE